MNKILFNILLLLLITCLDSSCRKSSKFYEVKTPEVPETPPPTVSIPGIYGTHYFQGRRRVVLEHFGEVDSSNVDSFRIDFAEYENGKILITLYLPDGIEKVDQRPYPNFSKEHLNLLLNAWGNFTIEYDTTARYIPALYFNYHRDTDNDIDYYYYLEEKK